MSIVIWEFTYNKYKSPPVPTSLVSHYLTSWCRMELAGGCGEEGSTKVAGSEWTHQCTHISPQLIDCAFGLQDFGGVLVILLC